MKSLYLSLFLVLSFFLPTYAIHHIEVDLEAYLPKQIPFKTLAIEADHIDARVVDIQGNLYSIDQPSTWPKASQIAEISFHGPEVKLILITDKDETITALLDSIDFDLKQQSSNGRRGTVLELSLIASKENEETSKKDQALSSLAVTLIRTILLGGNDPVYLYMQSTSDELTGENPHVSVIYNISGDEIEFDYESSEQSTLLDWTIKGQLSGESLLFNRIVKALQIVGKGAKLINVDEQHKKTYEKFLSYMERIADFTQPLRGWDGIGYLIKGFARTDRVVDMYFTSIYSRFQLEAVNESWKAWIDSNTFLQSAKGQPLTWKETVSISDPTVNTLKIARWLQANTSNDLAALLNCPSLTYLSKLGDVFAVELAKFIESIGEIDEDSMLCLTIEQKTNGITIGNINVNKIGASLVKQIKEKTKWW